MAIVDSLKSKKLPLGVFAGVKKGPSPARIFITIDYVPELEYCRGVRGFTVTTSQMTDKPTGTISFEIPVTPPTVDIDFGNEKDSENVARVGQIVLPKYKQAWQLKWDSFFPYDASAPYLNTSVRNLNLNTVNNLTNTATSLVTNAISSLTGISLQEPVPAVYIGVFDTLAKSEKPLTISMTYYDGGSLRARKYSLQTFRTRPLNNGDYEYSISFVEWTDIKPKLLDSSGAQVPTSNIKVQDSIKFKNIQNIQDFWNFCKQCYPVVSKKLVWAFSTYNGIRNLIFEGVVIGWKIKGSLQDLGGRFGILSNILGVSKITSKDTAAVSESLKKLSFSKASAQLADILQQNIST